MRGIVNLPTCITEARSTIERDAVGGAHDLARLAVEALVEVVRDGEAKEPDEIVDLLRLCAASLARARPAMSAVGNAAAEAFARAEKAIATASAPKAAATEAVAGLVKSLDMSMRQVAQKAADALPSDSTVLTTSFSRTVLEGLLLARPHAVLVTESRPALEGRRTAKKLAEAGIPVLLVTDAAGPSMVREADMVIIGADAVLADGAVVNKVGSYALALAAQAAGVPFNAACETLKISPMHTMPPEEHDGAEIWEDAPTSVELKNPYFELLPPELITGIITELGVVDVDNAARIAASRRAALRGLGLH